MLATRHRFGKFVLLEAMGSSGLGTEVRAAKLGPSGLEKIVTVLQLSPAICANADVARSLMEQAKVAAQLQSPNIVKIFGIGKVESVYYVSYEFLEGKSLKDVLARCRREGFPLSVDHGLLIASKVCSALEYAHGRRTPAGERYFHGLLTPASVVVSYEGEVRVRGFGYWPSRIREGGVLADEETRYLAPEQARGEAGDPRSDTYAVGALLYELVTGQALAPVRRSADMESQLAQARVWSPAGEDDGLPKAIAHILQRALAYDPGQRYAEIQEMRKAIDILLFSGDFTPTTFNLAFFMHSLFRDDIDRESRLFREEREANFQEYLGEQTPAGATAARDSATDASRLAAPADVPPAVAPAAPVVPTPADTAARRVGSTPVPTSAAVMAMPGPAAAPVPAPAAPPSPAPAAEPAAVRGTPAHEAAADAAPVRDAAAAITFHSKPERRSRVPLLAATGLAVVALAGGGYYFGVGPGTRFWRAPAPPPAPPSPSAEALALARVKELEEKLAALEAERAQAEAQAADEAKTRLEAQAAARGQRVDPAALQKAQEEARRKAQAEQEKRVQDERRRLEAEKAAEEARLAEEQRRAEQQRALEEQRRVEELRRAEEPRRAEEAGPVAAGAASVATGAASFAGDTPGPLAPPATTASAPAPTARPAIAPGTLVSLDDPGVIAPVVERSPPASYPPVALRQKIEGVVELNALIDERGGVVDAQVTNGVTGKSGLNEAAIESVKRRRYRPATRDGVPVRVWVKVRVVFELPR